MGKRLDGKWGEALALDFLRRKKYVLVDTGYRTRFGEVDIIVSDDKYVVFVEVKLRKDNTFALPRESVTPAKVKRIRTTAEIWLQGNETELQPRFDVIEVYPPEGGKAAKIIHLEDAF